MSCWAGTAETATRFFPLAGNVLRWHWLCRAGYPEELIVPRDPAWADVVARYEDVKTRCNALDQGDLVPLLAEGLRSDRDFQGFAHSVCRNLFIDDLQRLSPREFEAARLLTDSRHSITVTIDPNAGLPHWGDPEDWVLPTFREQFPGCENDTVALHMNIRSVHDLGQAVQRLTTDPMMDHLAEEDVTFSRELFDDRQLMVRLPPVLLEYEGRPVDMCRDILDRSLDLVGQGYELEDVAFIYEDIAMLEHLRLLALSRGVPYTVLGGESRRWDPDIRRMTALLGTVVNSRDLGAFRMAVSIDPRLDPPLDAVAAERLANMTEELGIDLVQAAKRYCANPVVDADKRRQLHQFIEIWEDLDRALRDPSKRVHDLCRLAVARLEDVLGPAYPLRDKPQVEAFSGAVRRPQRPGGPTDERT